MRASKEPNALLPLRGWERHSVGHEEGSCLHEQRSVVCLLSCQCLPPSFLHPPSASLNVTFFHSAYFPLGVFSLGGIFSVFSPSPVLALIDINSFLPVLSQFLCDLGFLVLMVSAFNFFFHLIKSYCCCFHSESPTEVLKSRQSLVQQVKNTVDDAQLSHLTC